MRKTTKVALGGAMTLALCTAGMAPAFADPNPIGTSATTGGDIVGVGSDTLQFVDDFVADGDSNLNSGYNDYHPTQRLVSFDAVNPWTQSANDLIKLRGSVDPAYNTSTGTLTSTDGLIVRPNGSGAGQKAIASSANCVSGAANNSSIDFARASSGLDSNGKTCETQAPFASDTIQIAVSKAGTLAPSAGLTPLQLKEIYEQTANTSAGEVLLRDWSQIPGSGGSGPITPILPQSSSGTYKTFLQTLGFTVNSDGSVPNLRTDTVNLVAGTANAVTTPVAGKLNITEEHNPQPFVTASQQSTPFDNSMIAPFSGGRAALVASGFFNFLNNGNLTAQSAYKNSVKLLPGTDSTPSDTSASFGLVRPLYHDFRSADKTKPWVTKMVTFFCSSAATPLIQDAGLTQLTSGCGTFS